MTTSRERSNANPISRRRCTGDSNRTGSGMTAGWLSPSRPTAAGCVPRISLFTSAPGSAQGEPVTPTDSVSASVDRQLEEQALDVRLDGVHRHEQVAGDLLGRPELRQALQDVELPFGQRLEQVTGQGGRLAGTASGGLGDQRRNKGAVAPGQCRVTGEEGADPGCDRRQSQAQLL